MTSPDAADTQDMLLTLLQDYLDEREPAVILVGHSLAAFHHLAHRVIKLEHGRMQERRLWERGERAPDRLSASDLKAKKERDL